MRGNPGRLGRILHGHRQPTLIGNGIFYLVTMPLCYGRATIIVTVCLPARISRLRIVLSTIERACEAMTARRFPPWFVAGRQRAKLAYVYNEEKPGHAIITATGPVERALI